MSGVRVGVSGVRVRVCGVRVGVSGVRVRVCGVRVGVSGVRVRVSGVRVTRFSALKQRFRLDFRSREFACCYLLICPL